MSIYRKPPRTPPGCEDHLTRQQAALLLGFSSEFKIRQLEREGRLQAVRGSMRTAFYAPADVLAVKAELAQESPGQEAADGWTDAELLLLLGSPNREGRPRTALDMVLETRISIDRAECVYAFWVSSRGAAPGAGPSARGRVQRLDANLAPVTPPEPRTQKSAYGDTTGAISGVTAAFDPAQATPPFAKTSTSTESVPAVAVPPATDQAWVAAAGPAQGSAPVARSAPLVPAAQLPPGAASENREPERRGEGRLSRDTLILQLRDPDPRVRHRAFALLKESQTGR
jgi:hypothetical protein